MQNSMAMFPIFCFRPEILFLDKYFQENINCYFELNFGTYNHVHNILRLFYGWTNYPLTLNERKHNLCELSHDN